MLCCIHNVIENTLLLSERTGCNISIRATKANTEMDTIWKDRGIRKKNLQYEIGESAYMTCHYIRSR